jgi:hypothetical protein
MITSREISRATRIRI